MAITFHRKGPDQLDITPYDVILDKEYTVQEFMDEILRERTYDKGDFHLVDSPGVIDYAYGHLSHGSRVTEPNASRKVKAVTAKVAWSYIDYYIEASDIFQTETGDADERES